MDIFDKKDVKPMLIGEMQEAFDDPDYIFELKLDGERCLAYLDKAGTDLRNKRNLKLLPKVPELSEINKQVKAKCILDGELIILKDGKPDFFEIRNRTLTSNAFKIQLAANRLPASFTAYDILYYKDHEVGDLPLMERKKLLQSVVKENERLAVSRYIEEQGIAFYKLTVKNELEGIVAKRRDSKYFPGKRTKDWIKIKNLMDDDFVICGYQLKDKGVISIIIAQYLSEADMRLVYKGHVTLGISSANFKIIKSIPRISNPFESLPPGNDETIWIKPSLVCTVKYMMKTSGGGLRQPVFKGLRDDKEPEECVEG